MIRINTQRMIRFISVTLALSMWASGLEAVTVKATGVGATEQKAVQQALENALSQHMQTTIVSMTQMKNLDVNKHSFAIDSGIVANYRVENIEYVNWSYIATVEAEVTEKPNTRSTDIIQQWQRELESLDDITGLLNQMAKTRAIREQYEQTFLSDFSNLYRATISDIRLLNEKEVELTITLALKTHVFDTYFDMLRKMPPLAGDVEAEGWFRSTTRESSFGRITSYSQTSEGILVDAIAPNDTAFYLAYELDGTAKGIGLIYRNILSQSRSGAVTNNDGVSEILFDGRGGVLNRTLNVDAYEHYPVFSDPDAHRVRNWKKDKPSVRGLSVGGFEECLDYPKAELYCGNVFEIKLRADIYVPRSTLSQLKDDFTSLSTIHVYPVRTAGPNVTFGSDDTRFVWPLGKHARSTIVSFE